MEINNYFLMLERTVAVWRTCPYCWHKWKEIYALDILHSDLPWDEEEDSNNG
jgi:hypothetical protein